LGLYNIIGRIFCSSELLYDYKLMRDWLLWNCNAVTKQYFWQNTF